MNSVRLFLFTALAMFFTEQQVSVGFEKIYGGPSMDRGVHVSALNDGGFVAVGVTQSFGLGGEDIYLVRTDASGDSLWTQTYGGVGSDNGWSVLQTHDGYMIAGYTRSFGAGGWDFYLIRTDSNGDTRWTRTYGGVGDDRCWALTQTTDGGFLLAGETRSFGSGQEDFYIVKVDSAGTELWSEFYGGVAGDRCFSVATADDGGYMLAGQTYSEGAGDRDAFVIKTDSLGAFEWSRTFGGAASDVGHYISRTSDGSFLVTGYTTSFATNGDDPYIIRIAEGGDTAWTRVLPIDGLRHTLTGAQAADGGFFLTGFSEHDVPRVYSAILLKTDADGNLEWFKDILPATGSGRSLGCTLRALSDGQYVFTGHTTVNSAGHFDLLLATGCLVNQTGDVTSDYEITSSDIIHLVNFVFKSGIPPQPCEAAGVANCNGAVNSADIVYEVNHVFKSGPIPCDVCDSIPEIWVCP